MLPYKWKLVSLLNCGHLGKEGKERRFWTVGGHFLSSASYSTPGRRSSYRSSEFNLPIPFLEAPLTGLDPGDLSSLCNA